MASVYYSILTTVQTSIQALDLSGISDANIVVRKRPLQRALPDLPGIAISPWGSVNIDPNAGTNERDDIEYPVLIATFTEGGKDQTANLDRHLQWHEDIRQEFINRRLSGVTSVIGCRVDMRDVYDIGAWDTSIELGWMILRFLSREVRDN